MFESLRESSIFNVKIETVGYSNITSNWISEIQQRVSVKHNKGIQYFNCQVLSNNILLY